MLAIAFCNAWMRNRSLISFAVYMGVGAVHLVMDGPYSLKTCQSNYWNPDGEKNIKEKPWYQLV